MGTAEEFRIRIPDEDLDDLARRLRSTRWADDFGNEEWAYGVERGWLEGMVEQWAATDWRASEEAMNALPHRRVVLDGVPVHFVHVRGTGPDPTPLVLTHGWPWTFWDFKDVIGPLTDPASHGGDPAHSFDLVVPSLPGFGFSSPLRTTGIGCRATALLWDRLMREVLGYDTYAAAGSDFGAKVSGELGHVFPDHVRGVHMTLLAVPGATPSLDPTRFTGDEAWMGHRMAEALPSVTSHLAVHRQDPQTLAYALTDSPVGMAAWIWERRRAWSDPSTLDEEAERAFLCDTASLYWFTRTIGSSMRFYRENHGDRLPPLLARTPRVPVPTAYGVAPRDVLMMPRSEAERETDLRRWSVYSRGGHFAPHEIPQEWTADVRAFFADLR